MQIWKGNGPYLKNLKKGRKAWDYAISQSQESGSPKVASQNKDGLSCVWGHEEHPFAELYTSGVWLKVCTKLGNNLGGGGSLAIPLDDPGCGSHLGKAM